MGKALLGLIMMLAGLVLGLYVGFWVCFIGGLIDIIHVIAAIANNTPWTALALGWGVLKMIIASVAGVGSALVLIIPGVALVQESI